MPPALRTFNHLLVTGGSGFIGAHLIATLLRNRQFIGTITNLDRLAPTTNHILSHLTPHPRYRLVIGDVTDASLVSSLLQQYHIDGIIHLAADSHVDYSIQQPSTAIHNNISSTLSLLEAIRLSGRSIHLHHVSTDEVYGSADNDECYHEHSRYLPSSPYSASKAASDHLVSAYHRTYGLSVTQSHCSNNYGAFQQSDKFLPLVIQRMINRQSVPIYGDGLQQRDWLHVCDHVSALWAIMQHGSVGTSYNVATGVRISNIALVYWLSALVANSLNISSSVLQQLICHINDRPGHDFCYAIDSTLIRETLGWKPTTILSHGIGETAEWYVQYYLHGQAPYRHYPPL